MLSRSLVPAVLTPPPPRPGYATISLALNTTVISTFTRDHINSTMGRDNILVRDRTILDRDNSTMDRDNSTMDRDNIPVRDNSTMGRDNSTMVRDNILVRDNS